MEEQRLQEIKNTVRSLGIRKVRKDPDASELFADLYHEVFHKRVCTTCPGKLGEAYESLLNFNIKTILFMSNRRFNFKKKTIVKHFVKPVAGVPTILTNNNLKDEHVPLLIAANPKYAELFTDSESPENEVVATTQAPPPATSLELRIEEIEATNTDKGLRAILKEKKISIPPKSTKTDLCRLLAEAELAK